MKRDELLGRLAMFLVVFTWGFAFAAVKYLLNSGWSQVQVAFVRIVIPGLTLAPYALFTLRRRWGQPQMQRLPALIVLGFFPFFFSHFLTVWGQKYTTAAVAGLLAVVSPLLALGLSALLKLERFTPLKGAGALVSVCGVVIVVLYGRGQAELSASSLLGPLMIILGVGMVGAYNTLIRAFHDDFSSLEVSALTAIWPSLVGLIPALFAWRTAPWISVASEGAAGASLGSSAAASPAAVGALPALNPLALLAVVWLGVFAGGLAVFCLGYAVSRLGPATASSFLYLNPVFSMLSGALLLGEVLTGWLLLGAALILSGLFLANRRA